MAGMNCSGGLHWFAQQIGHKGPLSEFNVLGRLWTARVTSHVALQEVSRLITRERILEVIGLIERALQQSGVPRPRIAVCGLNPHNGENGNFGREEIETIAPAVAQARSSGVVIEGPFPADTIFLKVQGDHPAYDAIVTMYHDQGQIAMKLMGFSHGVTVAGGLPLPITTPAHGTAFDITGSGKADVGAMRQAFELACRMARARREPH
jgi:4-hydroxythreonine-4-phosphate dehydrogenase